MTDPIGTFTLKAVGLGVIIGMLITPVVQWAGAAFGRFLARVF